MTATEWDAQWTRLSQFRVGGDADRGEVSAEWFSQLRHYHVDAVDAGVTRLIGTAKDTFLPGLGLLKELIQQRMDRYDRTPGKCGRCHGSGWVDAPAWKSNGIIYEGMQRCPACGIPAPQTPERPMAQPVSPVELAEYHAGRYGRELMPLGLEAKPRPGGEQTEMRAAMERLRIRLFGAQVKDGAA
jgi:hypothetical protein